MCESIVHLAGSIPLDGCYQHLLIHLSVERCLGSLQFGATMNTAAIYTYLCTDFCVNISFQFSWVNYLEKGFLGHMEFGV